MADTITVLNPGLGGDQMDESLVLIGGNWVKRPRVVIGDDNGPLAKVTNANPSATDYALATRNIPIKTTTGTTNSVASVIINTVLAASNAARNGLTVYNDSTANLYIKLGTIASTIDYTLKMEPYSYFELPYSYTGEIDGIWDAVNGSARITELT